MYMFDKIIIMKKIKKISLAILCTAFTFAASAQTLDEIVAKHIEAIGGKDNWSKLKSIKTESILKMQGAEINITSIQIDKKALRQDIGVMGMTGYSIVTKTQGWNYMPWQGQTKPEAMTDDDVKNQDDLYIQDEFITYKELEKQLEYYDKDDVDGTECFKLKMTDKDGQETTFYIDPTNYFVIKKTKKIKANGQETENSSFYGDYKKSDAGVYFPMSVTSGWGESEIVKLEINPMVDETIFTITK
jgi:hypothetical protein